MGMRLAATVPPAKFLLACATNPPGLYLPNPLECSKNSDEYVSFTSFWEFYSWSGYSLWLLPEYCFPA
jgi:hypothetical protein